jgi:hypothetical protein
MAATALGWIVAIAVLAAILPTAYSIIYLSSRRTYKWTISRAPVWVAVAAAALVGAFMFMGGWVVVPVWWLVRLPARWIIGTRASSN